MFKNQEELRQKYGEKNKSDWLNLKDGSNKVRIVSDFVDYGTHSIKEGTQFKSVVCIGKENHCPYCEKGLPARVQFLGWVIDRSDGQVKLLRIGWSIYEQLKNFQESKEYGFENLPPYDIDIVRTGTGLDTKYNIIPARKDSPLTEAEQAMVLKKIKDPQEIIDRMKEKAMVISDDKEEVDETVLDETTFDGSSNYEIYE